MAASDSFGASAEGVQRVFCVTRGCNGFVGSAVFASIALCTLTVAHAHSQGRSVWKGHFFTLLE